MISFPFYQRGASLYALFNNGRLKKVCSMMDRGADVFMDFTLRDVN